MNPSSHVLSDPAQQQAVSNHLPETWSHETEIRTGSDYRSQVGDSKDLESPGRFLSVPSASGTQLLGSCVGRLFGSTHFWLCPPWEVGQEAEECAARVEPDLHSVT